MSEPYEELLDGETFRRRAPGPRHEEICRRLHSSVSHSLTGITVAELLPTRTLIEISRDRHLRPDLALITAATKKLWLAAEIISPDDHNSDTVIKKTIYEEINLPRLWMIDPRYDNVEVYHGGPHGLALKQILALRDTLTEPLLPSFTCPIVALFKN